MAQGRIQGSATTTLRYIVNSDTINIKVPNTNSGSESEGNRILVYKITLEYFQ